MCSKCCGHVWSFYWFVKVCLGWTLIKTMILLIFTDPMLWTNIMLTWCQLQLPSTGICWSVKPKQDLVYIRHSGDPVPRCTQGSQKTPDVNFFVHSAVWVVSIDFATDWCDLFVTFSPGPEGQRDWMHLDLCIWTTVGSKMSCKQWSSYIMLCYIYHVLCLHCLLDRGQMPSWNWEDCNGMIYRPFWQDFLWAKTKFHGSVDCRILAKWPLSRSLRADPRGSWAAFKVWSDLFESTWSECAPGRPWD
jgi:hypothetical protein